MVLITLYYGNDRFVPDSPIVHIETIRRRFEVYEQAIQVRHESTGEIIDGPLFHLIDGGIYTVEVISNRKRHLPPDPKIQPRPSTAVSSANNPYSSGVGMDRDASGSSMSSTTPCSPYTPFKSGLVMDPTRLSRNRVTRFSEDVVSAGYVNPEARRVSYPLDNRDQQLFRARENRPLMDDRPLNPPPRKLANAPPKKYVLNIKVCFSQFDDKKKVRFSTENSLHLPIRLERTEFDVHSIIQAVQRELQLTNPNILYDTMYLCTRTGSRIQDTSVTREFAYWGGGKSTKIQYVNVIPLNLDVEPAEEFEFYSFEGDFSDGYASSPLQPGIQTEDQSRTSRSQEQAGGFEPAESFEPSVTNQEPRPVLTSRSQEEGESSEQSVTNQEPRPVLTSRSQEQGESSEPSVGNQPNTVQKAPAVTAEPCPCKRNIEFQERLLKRNVAVSIECPVCMEPCFDYVLCGRSSKSGCNSIISCKDCFAELEYPRKCTSCRALLRDVGYLHGRTPRSILAFVGRFGPEQVPTTSQETRNNLDPASVVVPDRADRPHAATERSPRENSSTSSRNVGVPASVNVPDRAVRPHAATERSPRENSSTSSRNVGDPASVGELPEEILEDRDASSSSSSDHSIVERP